jgi:hypothetical protein
MHHVKVISGVLIGCAVAAILFSWIGLAEGGDGEGEASDPAARAHTNLISRVRRALSSSPAPREFQLVVVSSGRGSYVETFGTLEPDDAAVFARQLHALADWVGASVDEACDAEEEGGDEEDDADEAEEEEDEEDGEQ